MEARGQLLESEGVWGVGVHEVLENENLKIGPVPPAVLSLSPRQSVRARPLCLPTSPDAV